MNNIDTYLKKESRLEKYLNEAINTKAMGAPKAGFLKHVRGNFSPRVIARQQRSKVKSLQNAKIQTAQELGDIVRNTKAYKAYDKLMQNPVVQDAAAKVQEYLDNPVTQATLAQNGIQYVSLKLASIVSDSFIKSGLSSEWINEHPNIVKTITASNLFSTISTLRTNSPLIGQIYDTASAIIQNPFVQNAAKVTKTAVNVARGKV